MRATTTTLALLAALVSSTFGVEDAGAAGTPITGIRWVLALDKRLPARFVQGCVIPSGLGWAPDGHTKAGEELYGTPRADKAAGAWSPATRTGTVAGRGDALLFDTLPTRSKKDMGRPIKLSNMGLEFAGGRLYVTGQVRTTKTRMASAPARQRLALIAHPRLLSGPAHTTGKPPVADSFLFALQGRATVTKALAAGLARARCKGSASGGRGRVRAGAALGQITAQLLPSAATGLAGTVDTALRLSAEDETDIAVAPSAGPTTVTTGGGDYLHFVLPAGTSIGLACGLGVDCAPASGSFTLPGQLALSYGGRTTVVAGLAVSYTLAGDGASVPTIAGTVDGVPVTIASEPNSANPLLSGDFLARVSAALGTTVTGSIAHLDVHFTSTGPAS
jgi:hypothetical protein